MWKPRMSLGIGFIILAVTFSAGHSALSSDQAGLPESGPLAVSRELVPANPELKAEALIAAAGARNKAERGVARELIESLNKIMAGLRSANELNSLGVILWLADKRREAVIVLAAAAQGSPDDFLPFNNLAAALISLGDPEPALIFLRYAAALAPGYPMVQTNTGTAYHGLGRTDEAKEAWERAVALDPKDVESNYGLGMSHRAAGNRAKAESYLRSSLLGGYTIKAASALNKITDQSKREPVLDPGSGTAETGTEIHLPDLPGSLREFTEAWQYYHKEPDRFISPIKAMSVRRVESAMKRSEEEKALEQARSEGVWTLSDRKANLGIAEAWRHQGRCDDLVDDFWRIYFNKDLLMRKMAQDRENMRITEAEEAECRKLTYLDKDRCLDEVDRRCCGRYYAYAEPLFREFRERYQEHVQAWQLEAKLFLGGVAHWAGTLPKAAAADEMLRAQLELIDYVANIHHKLEGAAHVLSPPRTCKYKEVPPPPTGEFRASDFETPCTFPGIHIGLGVVSLGVDCQKVTLGASIGFKDVASMVGEVEYYFVKKTATLYLGVGAFTKSEAALRPDIGLDAGVYICVDRRNTITDIGVRARGSAGATAEVLNAVQDIKSFGVGTRLGVAAGAVFE